MPSACLRSVPATAPTVAPEAGKELNTFPLPDISEDTILAFFNPVGAAALLIKVVPFLILTVVPL